MRGYVLRRSIPAIGGLVGLLALVGMAAATFAGIPLWIPAVAAVVLGALQFLISPWIVQWLVPATVIPNDGQRYATDDRVGAMVARRCFDAGIPLVKLGVVDDGTPNAFTFGRTPKDARMWLTRGLIERLDDDELDAVIAHELGHVKNLDFIVMAAASVVPAALYFVFRIALRANRSEARAVAAAAYLAYLVAQLVVLTLSRAREYGADHFSCACTGNGDALVSALVKIAYGMGEVDRERQVRAKALAATGKQGKKEAAALEHAAAKGQALRAMGIMPGGGSPALATALQHGIDPDRARAAMRWDVVNPWGRTLEKLSTHPLVARRIQALERSGLPGAPRRWSELMAIDSIDPALAASLRTRFVGELALALTPWALIIAIVGFGIGTGSQMALGLGLVVAGIGFCAKQAARYPRPFLPVAEITSLLEHLEAGPERGIPVEVRGTIAGRGMPGYVLSPDLVVTDRSGFVPLVYRQPVPFAAALFGLLRVPNWLGTEVVATGWYRRSPSPMVELASVRQIGPDGVTLRRARAWMWAARWTCSAGLVLVGLVVAAIGASG